MSTSTSKRKPSRPGTTAQGRQISDPTIPSGKGRIAIETVWPRVDDGAFPVKRVDGETIEVSADIFCDGHDVLAAELLHKHRREKNWHRTTMHLVDNDRWSGLFKAEGIGVHEFTIEAWRASYDSWHSEVMRKRGAGRDIALKLIEGTAIIDRAIEGASGVVKAQLEIHRQRLRDVDAEGAWATLDSGDLRRLVALAGERQNISRLSEPLLLSVDRERARFSAWYELFPRSAANDPNRHGTFDDVIGRLAYIRSLGFDVVYFPPIHPIGSTNRKGKNNNLAAESGDPGSVYAIGSEQGGHNAIHPGLGTLEDFRRLLTAAAEQDLEIAIDFAIQCSPDHPWIKEHPEWFDWRPDGTLKFAENPPKKYEDVVNVHFYRGALPGIWLALRDVVLFWVDVGVKIFRVDNPHTKPLPFWRWLIAEINGHDPRVLFLSEAFTRPKMMKRLAKVGFHQSYTYFTWRNTKAELTEYVRELGGEMADYFRPNFFTNTPDINPYYLQTSGRAGFVVRSTLAATLSGNWGIYSGFELCEAEPVPGREEYLNSEKYELRARDFEAPDNIGDHIATLNRIRRENAALQGTRNTLLLNASNDQIIAYFRATPDRDNALLVLVNLDPHGAQSTDYEVPLWEFGLPDGSTLGVKDLLLGIDFTLTGKVHRITLDPDHRSVAIWRLSLQK